MYWSPEGSYLTTLDEDGTLKVSNNITYLYDNSLSIYQYAFTCISLYCIVMGYEGRNPIVSTLL